MENPDEFNLTTSNFEVLAQKNYFIDKTLFIKEVMWNYATNILITAPHGFGKTTNLDMLRQFLHNRADSKGTIPSEDELLSSRNYETFKRLEIFKDRSFVEENYAKHPVIFTDFRNIKGATFEEILDSCRVVMHEIYKQFPYLQNSSKLSNAQQDFAVFSTFLTTSYKASKEEQVVLGLFDLTRLVSKHFDNQKVILLIDNAYSAVNTHLFDRNVTDLIIKLFAASLNNDYVRKAVLTDKIHLKSEPNLTTCFFQNLHEFVPFFGLTEPEVDCLFVRYRILDEATRKQVRNYYSYYLCLNDKVIYPVLSILKFLQTRKLQNHWYQSNDDELTIDFTSAFNIPLVRYTIQQILLLHCVPIPTCTLNLNDVKQLLTKFSIIPNNRNFEYSDCVKYLTVLWQEGLLSYAERLGSEIYRARPATYEILQVIENHLNKYYSKQYCNSPTITADLSECADSFNKIVTVHFDDETLQGFVAKFNKLLTSLGFISWPENSEFFHYLVFDVLSKTDFWLHPHVVPGTKRTNLLYSKGKLGLMIAVAHQQSAEIALKYLLKSCIEYFDNWCVANALREKLVIGLSVNKYLISSLKVIRTCPQTGVDVKYF